MRQKEGKKFMRHFITVSDFTKQELDMLINRASEMKAKRAQPSLKGKNLILLFFNSSLRTRTSFELAMQQLEGNVVTLNVGGDTWKLETDEGVVMDGDRAEHIKDAARVLGRYADAIGIRAFAKGVEWERDKKDPIIGAFVKHSGVSVINMESSLYHPNQVLADVMTIQERYGKDLRGLPVTLTWANHPNPLPMAVPNSFLLACALFGMDIRFVRPSGYDLDTDIMNRARELAGEAGGTLKVTDDFREGFEGAKVVYPKSWGSISYYGKKDEEREFRKRLGQWIVDDEKMALTDDAIFLHCLPVRRGVVVADSVLDSDRCLAYDEAENRLHAQKAVLTHLLGEDI
jgi:N-acetylornithine carbamoyltransferase